MKLSVQSLTLDRLARSYFCLFLLQLRRIQSQHQEELKRVTQDLEDESYNRSSMDKRLTNLRSEVSYQKRIENGEEGSPDY